MPTARFDVINQHGRTLKVVEPQYNKKSLIIGFVDAQGDSVIKGHKDSHGEMVIENAKPDDLDVTIRFMDAHGHHWLRSLNSVALDKRR